MLFCQLPHSKQLSIQGCQMIKSKSDKFLRKIGQNRTQSKKQKDKNRTLENTSDFVIAIMKS